MQGLIGRQSLGHDSANAGGTKAKQDTEDKIESESEYKGTRRGNCYSSDKTALGQIYELFGQMTKLQYRVQEKYDAYNANKRFD